MVDFGPEAYMISKNRLNLLQKCVRLSKMDWLWSRSVHYFRKWINLDLEVYSLYESGLHLVRMCRLVAKKD